MRRILAVFLLSVPASGLALGLALSSAGDAAAQAAADQQPVFRVPEGLTWGPLDPQNPSIRGEVTVLAGDPTKPGALFAVRARFPAGAVVPAHTHPTEEYVTVLSGTVRLSLGPEGNPETARTFGPGGFFYLPANVPHTFWADTEATIDVFSTGPLAIHYLRPPQ